MPSVMLSEKSFNELKSLAEPFVDTPESLIAELISAEVQRRGKSIAIPGSPKSNGSSGRRLSPDTHESLKHTRLLAAAVGDREIHRPKWNSLRDYLHVVGLKKLGSFVELRKASGANIRQGKYEEDGYKYLPDADISIQGADANLAWSQSLRLARALGVRLQVEFEWRNKSDAAHPGEIGTIEWLPSTTF